MTSTRTGLFKNLASMGLIQVANFVVPLLSVPYVSRIIGPENFGAINYANAYVVYFNMFISYGFSLTGVRKINIDYNSSSWRSKVFSEILYSQIILFVISLIVFIVLLNNEPKLIYDKKLFVFSMLSCVSSVLTQYWLFQAMQNLSVIAIINLLGKVLYLLLVVFLIEEKQDYYYQPLVLSISHIVIGFVSYRWATVKYNIELVKISIKNCIVLLWSEKAVFLSMVFSSLYTTANILVLGYFQSNEQVGYYTAGQKLIVVIQALVTIPLTQVLYPHISKAFSEDRNRGIVMVQKLFPIVAVFTFFISLIMIIAGPSTLIIFYGRDFMPAIPVFEILFFIPFLSALSNVIGVQLLLNLKKDKEYFIIITSCSILSVFCNILMVYKWGYIACAVNWLLTEAAILLVMFLFTVSKKIPLLTTSYFSINFLLEVMLSAKMNFVKKIAK